jgi:hypothetical protein
LSAWAAMAPETAGTNHATTNMTLPHGQVEEGSMSPEDVRTPKTKTRSLSDSTPRLEPSPRFREPPARMSKDDHHTPTTPRRPDFLSRGLSLQMPAHEAPMPSPAHFAARVPLSPQLDARNTYASPAASLLPRRSRGAEFSRACTHLHHSTLPEQSSPESSPTITQKGINIPSRKRSTSMIMNSPNVNMHSGWGNGDSTAKASSSVGSVNMMMGSEDSGSSSEEVDPLDPDDDPMMGTPQAKSSAFPGSTLGGNPGWAMGLISPVAGGLPNFMSIHRARLRKHSRSRKSSSSASGHSSMASPGPVSPPNGNAKSEGFFARETGIRKAGARRESLSLFANDLHISSGNDSGDEAAFPRTPGVVRRPVTRRGNLLVGHILLSTGEHS